MKVSKLVIALAAVASVAIGTHFGQAETAVVLHQPETFVPFATETSVIASKQAAVGGGIQQPEAYALTDKDDSAAAPDNKVVKEDRQKSRKQQGQRAARSRWAWLW